jgi:predicted ATPase
MGTGKSRLAAEVAAAVEAEGRPVIRVAANATLRDIPFGALMHLLPEVGTTVSASESDSIASALSAVLAQTDGSRSVLTIDDIHELDGSSAGVVAQALATGRVSVLATARTGGSVPDALMAHWRSGRVVAIELTALTRQSCDTLLHRVCGGAVDARAASELWRLSNGNPLFLRELVYG